MVENSLRKRLEDVVAEYSVKYLEEHKLVSYAIADLIDVAAPVVRDALNRDELWRFRANVSQRIVKSYPGIVVKRSDDSQIRNRYFFCPNAGDCAYKNCEGRCNHDYRLKEYPRDDKEIAVKKNFDEWLRDGEKIKQESIDDIKGHVELLEKIKKVADERVLKASEEIAGELQSLKHRLGILEEDKDE
jgi:hypothetical protein